MVKKLYEVRNRSGDLILENATSGEIREELHCTTAQVNNARTSGDHIFGEYKVEEIDRKLSRKTDFDLRNQHFRSSGKFIRSKYEKCGKYNKNIDSTPQKKR